MPLVGNIHDLKWPLDAEVSAAGGSPAVISTPHLEVRIFVMKPGQYPPCHRHHEEMDEGYLLFQGRGLMSIDGETFEVGAGDIFLGKRGGFHTMKNIGDEDLIEFNFRGGRMPSLFIPTEGGTEPFADGKDPTPSPEARDRCLKMTLKEIRSSYDPTIPQQGSRRPVIATPHLELLTFTRPPGDKNATHRHQADLDEAVFIAEGPARMLLNIGGENIEARAGDLIHIPGGTWHRSETTEEGPLTVLNMRGGNLPVITERNGDIP